MAIISWLPSHAYKLNFNDSPFSYCTLHLKESIRDPSHILFYRPSLSTKCLILINSIKSLITPFSTSDIINSSTKPAIILITSYIHDAFLFKLLLNTYTDYLLLTTY